MSQHTTNPWEVVEADFPVTAPVAEQIRFLLNYAVVAPSRHNVQPWLFHVERRTVSFFSDRSRALLTADPENREMLISCGAALANFLIAARYFGFAPLVALLPDEPEQPDLLARITLERGVAASEEAHALFRAILERRTNRQPFKDQPLPESFLASCADIAGREGTGFQVIEGGEARYAVASLIARGDQLLWGDERFRQEIARWTRPLNDRGLDGVPEYALGRGDMVSYLGPLKIRTFMEQQEVRASHHLASGSPVLAVLWTFGDTRFDWLAAGQALEKILLHARTRGVWASFFSQPIEVATLRTELCAICGRTDFPQLVLRMGYGSPVPPTPRRPVRDVLI